MYRWCAHSTVVLFCTLYRGQRDTRICPYLVSFATLNYSLPFSKPRSIPIYHHHCSLPSSSMFSVTASLSLAPVWYLHDFYHHRISTCTPSVLFIYSHRSRSDWVLMNCANVFFLLQIYSSIASNTASLLASAAEVYSHLILVRLCRILPVNRITTWSLNPPRTGPWGGGVTTGVSLSKISTDCTMELKKKTDTLGAVTSILIIFVNLRHTARVLARLLTTAGQSLSSAEITIPKYLKEVTVSRGCPSRHYGP